MLPWHGDINITTTTTTTTTTTAAAAAAAASSITTDDRNLEPSAPGIPVEETSQGRSDKGYYDLRYSWVPKESSRKLHSFLYIFCHFQFYMRVPIQRYE